MEKVPSANNCGTLVEGQIYAGVDQPLARRVPFDYDDRRF
jgi:hypothetical protein